MNAKKNTLEPLYGKILKCDNVECQTWTVENLKRCSWE